MKLKEAIKDQLFRGFLSQGYDVYIKEEDVDSEKLVNTGGGYNLTKVTIDEDKGITKEVIDNCDVLYITIGKERKLAIVIKPSWIKKKKKSNTICDVNAPLISIMKFILNNSVIIQVEDFGGLIIACTSDLKDHLPPNVFSIYSHKFWNIRYDLKVIDITKYSIDNVECYKILTAII